VLVVVELFRKVFGGSSVICRFINPFKVSSWMYGVALEELDKGKERREDIYYRIMNIVRGLQFSLLPIIL
jgi:hypothetical protein